MEESHAITGTQRLEALGLSSAEQKVLDAIRVFINAKGYPPTYRELAPPLETTHTTVARHVRSLRDKGKLTFDPGVLRSIRLVDRIGKRRAS